MVQAPSVIGVLRSWQHEVSLPGVPQKLYAMRPDLPALRGKPLGGTAGGGRGGSGAAAHPHPAATGNSGGGGDCGLLPTAAEPLPRHVDLAIVNSVFSWRPARLSMGLVFLLDRGRCTALRAYFKECVLPMYRLCISVHALRAML